MEQTNKIIMTQLHFFGYKLAYCRSKSINSPKCIVGTVNKHILLGECHRRVGRMEDMISSTII